VADSAKCTALSRILREEGEQIESLSYALWSLAHRTTDDDPVDRAIAMRDIDRAHIRLRDLELSRAVHAMDLATDLGRDADLALVELADAAGGPCRAQLLIHHQALAEAVSGLDALSIAPDGPATRNGPDDNIVNRAVPRSLVWFLRTPLTERRPNTTTTYTGT
jgi:hypothetical protein